MAAVIRRTYRGKDGKKHKCDHWTIQYRNAAGKIERITGYKDKGATMQLAAKLERNLARGEQGLTDPFKAHRGRAIAEHLADYIADLKAAGRDEMYVSNAEHRLAALVEACGWKVLDQIEPNSFMQWRERERTDKRKGPGRSGNGASATTLNQYLDTARAFCNWCAAAGRMPGVPLTNGKIVSPALGGITKAEGPKVRNRRALSDEQVTALLAAAPIGRKLVYRFALATGLRRQELEDLKWGDVKLSAIPAYLQLRSEATKARRGDRVPLPATLAESLRRIKPEGDGGAVFATVPSIDVWKEDLAAAGIPYKDAMGKVADFHGGTRKTLCTRMHRNNVPLAVAMRTMRHTDARLTMVDYADDQQIAAGQAILPELAGDEPQQATAQA